jgi:hypothetical protein
MPENFTVLSQKQDIKINPAGTGFEDVWEITYKVTSGPSKGTVAVITVPEEDHNARYIATVIKAKIATLDEVASF